jgi:hypothetical protein
MGFLGTLLGIIGFGIGIPVGLLLGFFLFIYVKPGDDVKVMPVNPIASFFFSFFINLNVIKLIYRCFI